MRVVFDTNVFISSFFGGIPGDVIRLWHTGEVTLCLTGKILDEYLKVLQRMGLDGTKEFNELLGLFKSSHNAVFTSKTPSLSVADDKDDDKFIEAAVAHNAEIIVSGDKHLLSLKEYMKIRILSPREFIGLFRK
jgi:hypothetical protein